MEQILEYLRKTYHPQTMILYGSYADGSENAGSDFDAFILSDCPCQIHDVTIVNGIQMDVFVYPVDMEFLPEELIRLYHGKIVIDQMGKGRQLMDSVKTYIDNYPARNKEDIRKDLVWCEKMVERTLRGDAEGFFRWHWVLCDSLQFYSDIRCNFYFGPKKTLRSMEQNDPQAFEIYSRAISGMDRESLVNWVNYLKNQMEG